MAALSEVLIEGSAPDRWQDLESKVAQILAECKYDVEVQKNVGLARGDVNVDVWADDYSSPPNVIAVECKHWATPATKSVVHAFRTVVGDSGANTGLLVSSAGFQEGAIEAAAYSNVRLLTWLEFQAMFADRWFRTFMAPTLAEADDALQEYTEAINTRIFRKADALTEPKREQFKTLRKRYLPLAALNFSFHPAWIEHLPDRKAIDPIPSLPLRARIETHDDAEWIGLIADEVLDASALRPLLEAMIQHAQRAIAEFDDVFGERA